MDDFSDYRPPDLSHMSTDDLCQLLIMTGASHEPTDRAFAKACRDEIAKRKPSRSGDNGSVK
jgi:hypothetical protein